jgi:hypothetical protein
LKITADANGRLILQSLAFAAACHRHRQTGTPDETYIDLALPASSRWLIGSHHRYRLDSAAFMASAGHWKRACVSIRQGQVSDAPNRFGCESAKVAGNSRLCLQASWTAIAERVRP